MQVQRVAQRIPGLPVTSPVRGVVDLYDVTDDWIPIYDKSDLPGFYMAVGTSGNQFKNAPVVGAMMAELISACEQGRDHDRYPLPFRLERTGRTLNLGFFSRRRAVNPRAASRSWVSLTTGALRRSWRPHARNASVSEQGRREPNELCYKVLLDTCGGGCRG